eukprot:3126884-Amphidinium_carterae.1
MEDAYVASDHKLVSCQIAHVRHSTRRVPNKVGWTVPDAAKAVLQHEVESDLPLEEYTAFEDVFRSIDKELRPKSRLYSDPWKPELEALQAEHASSDDPMVRKQLARRIWILRKERMRVRPLENDSQDIKAGRFPRRIHPEHQMTHFNGTSNRAITAMWMGAILSFLAQWTLPDTPKPYIPLSDIPLPFTSDEVTSAIARLAPHRAPGVDQITPEMLWVLPAQAHQWLAALFTGIGMMTVAFPETWTIVKFLMLPKRPMADLPQHLRPIGLMSYVAKVYSSILASRLRLQLVLPEWIFSYRRYYQCVEVPFILQLIMEQSMAWNLGCEILKLDITKAYDSVSFPLLYIALLLLGASAGNAAATLRLLSSRKYIV